MTAPSRAMVPEELRIAGSLWRRPSGLALFGVAAAGTAVLLPVAPLAAMGVALMSIPMVRFSMPRLQSLAALVYAGRLDEAWDTGWRLAVRERDPRWKAYVVGLLGMVETRRGNLDRAQALFEEALARTFPHRRVKLSVRGSYAEALALNGDVDGALKALPDVEGPDFSIDWDRLVVWCRAGRHQDVLGHRAKLHRQLHRRFPAWAHHDSLLRAFSASRVGRSEGEIDRYLRRVLKPYPSFYDYLGVRWPEMREFLQAYSARIPVERPALPSTTLHRVGHLAEPGGLPATTRRPLLTASSGDDDPVDPESPASDS